MRIFNYFKSKLSKREKLLFCITVGLVFIFSLFYSVVNPIIDEWKRLDKEIRLKEIKLMKNKFAINNAKTIKSEYEKYKRFFSKTNKTNEEEMVSMLKEVERVSKQTGARIINIKPCSVNMVSSRKEFKIDFQLELPSHSLAKFIFLLQNSPLRLKIQKSRIEPMQGEPQCLKALFSIKKILLTGEES